jgi:hypothetical protein
MPSLKQIAAALFLLTGFVQVANAADLKIVLLDSKSGNPLHSKLVCVIFSSTEPIVANPARSCIRTDGTGTATFQVPASDPQSVKVDLATNNLVPCFAPQEYSIVDAAKDGLVARNTCRGGTTETKDPGELVLYAHQKSVKEALGQARDEW